MNDPRSENQFSMSLNQTAQDRLVNLRDEVLSNVFNPKDPKEKKSELKLESKGDTDKMEVKVESKGGGANISMPFNKTAVFERYVGALDGSVESEMLSHFDTAEKIKEEVKVEDKEFLPVVTEEDKATVTLKMKGPTSQTQQAISKTVFEDTEEPLAKIQEGVKEQELVTKTEEGPKIELKVKVKENEAEVEMKMEYKGEVTDGTKEALQSLLDQHLTTDKINDISKSIFSDSAEESEALVEVENNSASEESAESDDNSGESSEGSDEDSGEQTDQNSTGSQSASTLTFSRRVALLFAVVPFAVR